MDNCVTIRHIPICRVLHNIHSLCHYNEKSYYTKSYKDALVFREDYRRELSWMLE